MSINTLPIVQDLGLEQGLQAPEVNRDWTVLDAFKELSEFSEIDGQPVKWLLSDVLMCFDGHDGRPNNTNWHISVAIAERTTAVPTTLESIDPTLEVKDAGNNVRQYYVYSNSDPNGYDQIPAFYVFATDGEKIINLAVESAGSYHTGHSNGGNYDATNEFMDITCAEPGTGYHHTIYVNKGTGSGVVEFDQRTTAELGWLLSPAESADIMNLQRDTRTVTTRKISKVAVNELVLVS